MRFNKSPFFVHTCPHPPAAATPANADSLRKQVERTQRAQGLHDDSRWHGLPYSPKGNHDEGERLHIPQVCGEVRPALSYELGVDILTGNLVWIQGPYPAGKYTDIKIFNKVLRNFLEPGERVEADEGYRGHPDKIKCPGNNANPAENRGM